MATTRLGLTGVSADPYAGFDPKEAGKSSDPVTRLGLAGVSAARYPGFLPKQPAVIVPGRSGSRRRVGRPLQPVEGEAYGIVPLPIVWGRGRIGFVGTVSVALPAPVASVAGETFVTGTGRVSLRLGIGRSEGAAGIAGTAFSGVPVPSAHADGYHDPDEEAVLAWLLAA